MSNDDSRMEAIIREIAEGIVPEHEENILQVFIESLRGDTDV